MTIKDLTNYLDRTFKTTFDSRMFPKGTIIKVKSIDIRKFDGRLCTRFRCVINDDTTRDDAYLLADDFCYGVEEVI